MSWELTEDERNLLASVLTATLLRARSHTAYARGPGKATWVADCARLESALVLLSTRDPDARVRARGVPSVGNSTSNDGSR